MSHEVPVISPKKLIEVALPLDAINAASVHESYIYRGNPSALHKWWAQRPLAAARAVIFSQLVNDPEDLWRCQNPGVEPNKQVKGHWTKARAKLFTIIEDLVKWENTTNEVVLNKAREDIRRSWRETCELNQHHPQAEKLFDPEKMPGLYDPFAGGGTIPLEAQRLGLEAYASDLNPVAVLINKAMIEIPPNFAGHPPVNPDFRKDRNLLEGEWKGVAGLAEDVRHYGQRIRAEAMKQIGHFYPSVEITDELLTERPDLEQYRGQQLTTIAWLWARSVQSPNPAFSHIDVPLASTFVLSSKAGKGAYVVPSMQGDTYNFKVQSGIPPKEAKAGTKAGRGGNFRCLMSGTPIDPAYIRSEGVAGRIKARLMAVVAEGRNGRIYLSPSESLVASSLVTSNAALPEGQLPEKHRAFTPMIYGMTEWKDLFTSRQLSA